MPRERHLELWLGASCQSLVSLTKAYETMGQKLVHDVEMQDGLRILQCITKDTRDIMKPFTEKYKSNNTYGHEISEHLLVSLCPTLNGDEQTRKYKSPYGVLVTLTGLHVYLAHIEGHLTALVPVSQAIWDADLKTAVDMAISNIARMQSWVKNQITVRSPQTLIVPSTALIERGSRWIE